MCSKNALFYEGDLIVYKVPREEYTCNGEIEHGSCPHWSDILYIFLVSSAFCVWLWPCGRAFVISIYCGI